MSIDSFFTKYLGRYIDFDNKYGFQCVDLMRRYCVDVLGIGGYSIPAVTYAKQIFTSMNDNGTTKFQKIYNSPTNSPAKGDIVIWGYYPFVTGWAGHVAICSSASMMSLITYDQNYPTGSSCHFQKHSYKGVLGWLHPKV